MEVLVGWDHAEEAETIELLLNAGELGAQVTTDPLVFRRAASEGSWDVVILALNFPSADESFALFEKVQAWQREVPILGACRQGEIVHLARFISHGLYSVVTRDPSGEFILLLPSVIEAAHAASQAQRAKQLSERLREEIESVRQLQKSVIPREIPMPPGYQIAARYEPSEIRVMGDRPVILAGGDYYDLYSLDHRNVILLVGDAAGHGIKACLSIMTMRTLIHMIRDQSYTDTSHFVAEVNRRLIKHAIVSDEGGFITLLYCALDTTTNILQWTSAGHPLPLLQNLKTGEIRPLASPEQVGLPLGIDPDEDYHTVRSRIPAHSRLVLYSDGLADAFPAGGDPWSQFGEKGIKQSLLATADLSPSDALDKLFADSNAFTRGAGRHDDTSVVLVEKTVSQPRRSRPRTRERETA